MPKRFDQYQFKDGLTSLGASTFNFIFGDLDTRIADLEGVKISWDAAIQDVVAFGLTRLDQVIQPMQAEGNAAIAEVIAKAAESRAAFEGLKADSQDMKSQIQTAINSAKASLSDLPTTLCLWSSLPSDSGTSELPAFDGNGRLSSLTSMLNGLPRVMTPAFDGAGQIQKTVTTWNGHTRTEVFTFLAGVLQSIAVTES